jgi:hypothetical protein
MAISSASLSISSTNVYLSLVAITRSPEACTKVLTARRRRISDTRLGQCSANAP